MFLHPSLSACLALLMAGISAAMESGSNNLRISLQLIEVPHPALTEMLAGNQSDGSALHQQAMARVKSGGAKIVESAVLMSRSGQRNTLETLREMLFPSETMWTGGFCGMSGFQPPPPPKPARNLRFIPPCSDCRNTGLSLEVEPTLQENGHIIELRVNAEMVAPIREISWLQYGPEWGGGPVRTPIFEVWRTSTNVILTNGQFECVSLISPKNPAPAPAVARKILVFVRADVVPVPHSP